MHRGGLLKEDISQLLKTRGNRSPTHVCCELLCVRPRPPRPPFQCCALKLAVRLRNIGQSNATPNLAVLTPALKLGGRGLRSGFKNVLSARFETVAKFLPSTVRCATLRFKSARSPSPALSPPSSFLFFCLFSFLPLYFFFSLPLALRARVGRGRSGFGSERLKRLGPDNSLTFGS